MWVAAVNCNGNEYSFKCKYHRLELIQVLVSVFLEKWTTYTDVCSFSFFFFRMSRKILASSAKI
jgi:hypothetical protein